MSHDHHNHHNHGPVETSTVNTLTTMDHSNHDTGSAPGITSEHGSGHHNTMMHMFFHGGMSETILFEQWQISEIGGLIGSMIAIFFLAFFYEALKFYREHLYRHSFQTVEVNTSSMPTENGGAVKETHKTVQITSIPASVHPYGTPEVNPIFISQSTCACPGNKSTEISDETGENCGESNSQNPENNNSSCLRSNTTKVIAPRSFHYKVKILSFMHIGQTCLHVIQVILSYFLMLIFMTYNGWLCLSVAVGAGAGYFFFGWKKSLVVDITEHCH